MSNLILHAGSFAVTAEEVQKVATPIPSETHHPIPHFMLYDSARVAFDGAGFEIVNEQHALAAEGQRYFGLLELVMRGAENGKDYARVVGLRNSHDKTFPAGAIMGSEVLVCDNLAFSSEIKLLRRHTAWILRDLPGLMFTMVRKIAEKWVEMDTRYSRYKEEGIGRPEVDQTLIRAMELKVIPVTKIPSVLREWKNPTFDHGAENVWRLFNAFTQVLKGGSLFELPNRTQGLHVLLDRLVDFQTVKHPDPLNQLAPEDVYRTGIEYPEGEEQ